MDFEKSEEEKKTGDLQTFLRSWGIEHNIRQHAMKPLLQRLNQLDSKIPTDPRRLLSTPRNKKPISSIEGGQYWHQGIEICLRRCFTNLNESCSILININIDGLPLFNNGTDQVWLILFNIHSFMPEIDPMVIGVFHGRSKPKKIEQFLEPFASKILPILENGLVINGFKMLVKIRAFICDSPARAFIKGVVNFNSLHGCLKCCTVGHHSTLLRTNIFPNTSAIRRTDSGFRKWMYEGHYQHYKIRENGKLLKQPIITPLLKLPIDIVEDVIKSTIHKVIN
ncbi:uncharacterized protein LOC135699230 [Ochlerotatus camptorhynchus]|uniref:uncharacterized protein LOC135699230 n=1 Tax=Ochlerotatus camptorhynchus TaxID=644619 RepID=UPI0031D28839